METFHIPSDVLEARTAIRRVLSPSDIAALANPPTGLLDIGHSLGVTKVVRRSLSTDQSGMLDGMLIPLDDGYVIAVNQDVAESRQRYSLAHEIGHLIEIKDPDSTRSSAGTGPRFKGLGGHENKQEERRCEAIAAELLMPFEDFTRKVREAGQSLASVPFLARVFETSITSTAIRLLELMVEPALLVRWKLNRAQGTGLEKSWDLRNEFRGPSVQISKNLRGSRIFEGAQAAWTRPGLHTSTETISTRGMIGKTRYVQFPEYRTESMGFGLRANRFVLSLVYLNSGTVRH